MRPFAKRNAMTPPKPPSSSGLDRFAVVLSGLCLLHCLAVPFAILLGPMLGQWLTHSETEVHWLLLALALPISAVALSRGYSRHHSPLTLVLGAAGLALMFIGVSHVIGEDWEIILTVAGVSSLLLAHIRNMLGSHRHA
jgi:hypothetical protein